MLDVYVMANVAFLSFENLAVAESCCFHGWEGLRLGGFRTGVYEGFGTWNADYEGYTQRGKLFYTPESLAVMRTGTCDRTSTRPFEGGTRDVALDILLCSKCASSRRSAQKSFS